MWWVAWLGCELTVDFDPEAMLSPGESRTTADTGGLPTSEVPTLVQGTECSGFVPDLDAGSPPIDIEFDPLTGPVTFSDVEIEEIVFGTDTSVAIRVGEVPGPRVEPPTNDGSVVFAQLQATQLFVFSFCGLAECGDNTVVITLPATIDRILGETVHGDITITNAALTDVYVASNRGDVQITGGTWGVRAEALDGSISLDTPSAQVVDLHTSTGPITMRGTATTEFCAISDLGDLDVVLEASARASLRATNGSIVADLASRVGYLELDVVVGGADVRMPGGTYDIDLVSIPEDALLLEGIVHDASASDQITGSSLGTGTRLRAR